MKYSRNLDQVAHLLSPENDNKSGLMVNFNMGQISNQKKDNVDQASPFNDLKIHLLSYKYLEEFMNSRNLTFQDYLNFYFDEAIDYMFKPLCVFHYTEQIITPKIKETSFQNRQSQILDYKVATNFDSSKVIIYYSIGDEGKISIRDKNTKSQDHSATVYHRASCSNLTVTPNGQRIISLDFAVYQKSAESHYNSLLNEMNNQEENVPEPNNIIQANGNANANTYLNGNANANTNANQNSNNLLLLMDSSIRPTSKQGCLKIFDLQTSLLLWSFDCPFEIYGDELLHISSDSQRLVIFVRRRTMTHDKPKVFLFNLYSGEMEEMLWSYDKNIRHVTVSSNSKSIYASDGLSLIAWDTSSNKEDFLVNFEGIFTQSILLCPTDESFLFALSSENKLTSVRIISVAEKSCIKTITVPDFPCQLVLNESILYSFSPNENSKIKIHMVDLETKVYETKTIKLYKPAISNFDEVYLDFPKLFYSRDRKQLLASQISRSKDSFGIDIFSLQTFLKDTVHTINEAGHTSVNVYSLQVSPSGMMLMTASMDQRTQRGEICLWQQLNGSIVAQKKFPISTNLCVILPDDEHFIYLDSADFSLKLYNHCESKVERIILGFKENLAGLLVHDSGKKIITLGKDGTARLWSLSTGEEVRWIFNDPDSQIVFATLSRSERYLYLLLDPLNKEEHQVVKLVFVELNNGKIQEKFLNSRDYASSKLFADIYNENIVYITKDKQLNSYDKELNDFQIMLENKATIRDAALSGGGELIIIADEEKKIVIYSLKNKRIMMSLKLNQNINLIIAGIDNYSFYTLHVNPDLVEIKLWDYKILMESGKPSAICSKNLSQNVFHGLNTTKYGDSLILKGCKSIGGQQIVKMLNISSSLKGKFELRNIDFSQYTSFEKFENLSYASRSATSRGLGLNFENKFCLFQFEAGELTIKKLLLDQSLVAGCKNFRITPDGLKMVFQIPAETESDSSFLFWNDETMEKEIFNLKGVAASEFELTRHGEYIMLLSRAHKPIESIIRVFSIENSKITRKILLPSSSIKLFIVSNKSPYKLLTGGEDGVVRVYEISSGTLERKISAFNHPIDSLTISTDNRRVIVFSMGNNSLKEFNLDSGLEVSTYQGAYIGFQIATNSDNTKLFTCCGAQNSLTVLDKRNPGSLMKVKWCLELLKRSPNIQTLVKETPRSLWDNVSRIYTVYPFEMSLLHYLIYTTNYQDFDSLLSVCEAHNVFIKQQKDIFLRTPLEILLNENEIGADFLKRLLKHIKKGLMNDSRFSNTQITTASLEKIIGMELTDLEELLNLLIVTLIRIPDLEAYLIQERNKGRKASSLDDDGLGGNPVIRFNKNTLITSHPTVLPSFDLLSRIYKKLEHNEVSKPVEIKMLDIEGIALISNNFIKTVLKNFPPSHAIYDSPVFATIVTFKWKLFAKKYFLMQGGFLLFFALLYVINAIYILPIRTEIPDEMSSSKGFSIFLDLVLFIFYLIFLAWEGFQLKSLGIHVYLRKLFNFWGFINCVFLLLMLPAIFIDLGHAAGHTPDKDVKAFHSVTIFFLWIKLLGILRGIDGGSFMIRSLAHIFLELKYFWLILFSSCVGFSFCAYIVQDTYRVDLFNSFRAVYNMMLGDFERFETLQTSYNPGILWLVLMFTTIILTMLMLNLITAFIIELYERENNVEKSGNIYDKALLVRDIEDIIPQREIEKLKKEGKDNKYIFIITVESNVSLKKERSAEIIDKKIKNIEKSLENLRESIEEMGNSIKIQKKNNF